MSQVKVNNAKLEEISDHIVKAKELMAQIEEVWQENFINLYNNFVENGFLDDLYKDAESEFYNLANLGYLVSYTAEGMAVGVSVGGIAGSFAPVVGNIIIATIGGILGAVIGFFCGITHYVTNPTSLEWCYDSKKVFIDLLERCKDNNEDNYRAINNLYVKMQCMELAMADLRVKINEFQQMYANLSDAANEVGLGDKIETADDGTTLLNISTEVEINGEKLELSVSEAMNAFYTYENAVMSAELEASYLEETYGADIDYNALVYNAGAFVADAIDSDLFSHEFVDVVVPSYDPSLKEAIDSIEKDGIFTSAMVKSILADNEDGLGDMAGAGGLLGAYLLGNNSFENVAVKSIDNEKVESNSSTTNSTNNELENKEDKKYKDNYYNDKKEYKKPELEQIEGEFKPANTEKQVTEKNPTVLNPKTQSIVPNNTANITGNGVGTGNNGNGNTGNGNNNQGGSIIGGSTNVLTPEKDTSEEKNKEEVSEIERLDEEKVINESVNIDLANMDANNLPDKMEVELGDKDYDYLAREQFEAQGEEAIALRRQKVTEEANRLFDNPDKTELINKLKEYGYSDEAINNIIADRNLTINALVVGDQKAELSKIAKELAMKDNVENFESAYDQLPKYGDFFDGTNEKLLMNLTNNPEVKAAQASVLEAEGKYTDAVDIANKSLEELNNATNNVADVKAQIAEEILKDPTKWGDKAYKEYQSKVDSLNSEFAKKYGEPSKWNADQVNEYYAQVDKLKEKFAGDVNTDTSNWSKEQVERYNKAVEDYNSALKDATAKVDAANEAKAAYDASKSNFEDVKNKVLNEGLTNNNEGIVEQNPTGDMNTSNNGGFGNENYLPDGTIELVETGKVVGLSDEEALGALNISQTGASVKD